MKILLKSVGMTPKSFNKIINYRVLSHSVDAEFAVPWGSVSVTVIAVFAIVRSTILYATSKIKKENIIENRKYIVNT